MMLSDAARSRRVSILASSGLPALPTPPPALMADAGDEKRTVRAGRRRRGQQPADGRRRAEAPRRRRPGGSGGGPSGGGPSGGGPRLPQGRNQIVLLVVAVIVVVCIMPLLRMLGIDLGGTVEAPVDDGSVNPPLVADEDTIPPTAVSDFEAPPVSSEGETWTVMLYQNADDKVLEEDIFLDLNEAERVGSTDRVQIVAQLDRYRGGYSGDGDWTGTRRYYVTQDNDLNRIGSTLVQDLGEANMADANTLVDFVVWAAEEFPADNYVLIMSDHGIGWPGGWGDPTATGGTDRNIPLTAALGDQIYLMELDDALGEIRERTGIEKFELIGMDACLMGHLEVFAALAPHANYAVASQEVEPALGWAYTGFLGELTRNPDVSGAELGRFIVESYIDEDQRIVDDEARAAFATQGSPLGSLFGAFAGPSADQIARQLSQNITLTAADLTRMPGLMAGVNNLAAVLQQADQRTVAQARGYAQSFTNVFGQSVPASYIDLGHFARLLAEQSRDIGVDLAVDELMLALDEVVIAERHGPNKPGASGVSIYFPTSQLYRNPATGPQSYTAIAARFATVSLWDDFLAFHYTGNTFDVTASAPAIPPADAALRAPGAGTVTATPLQLSSDVAAPGAPVLLSSDISGDNIGYVYLFVGFYDAAANAIFVADRDYLESTTTRELEGVFYPDWGDGEFTLEFEWEPIVFAINDGARSEVALFTPRTYGATFEEATYTVDGIYTYADGEQRHARLLFQDGLLRQVFGFTGSDGSGAPREILPQTGDQFTVLEQWLDLDAQGRVVEATVQEGGTLVFGEEMFFLEELDAPAGAYVVGFVVEDLDGNSTEVYAQLTVR